ncbi:hypothetical protein JZ751_005038 [Albula glossodonta]|uniref:Uncharacterized protein n=1 Tax=Albula glossodonta TaxID=121402 RepID=A0A8T2P894_9TELE|nr:hypothetical protein JZ751_005038 [Albula glossodonta]
MVDLTSPHQSVAHAVCTPVLSRSVPASGPRQASGPSPSVAGGALEQRAHFETPSSWLCFNAQTIHRLTADSQQDPAALGRAELQLDGHVHTHFVRAHWTWTRGRSTREEAGVLAAVMQDPVLCPAHHPAGTVAAREHQHLQGSFVQEH